MDLPVRKNNRLSNYDYSQNGAYFITICTKDRCEILSKIVGDDAHIVPTYYGLVLEKYIQNVPEIEKYVIMPDHLHLIIRLDSGSMKDGAKHISNIVRSLKTLTVKETGKAIFQRSYYDHVIRNQNDYNEIWEYIENNPKRWSMQKEGRC